MTKPGEDAASFDPVQINTHREFADALTGVREEAVLTVRELSKKAGIPASTLGGYFSGRHLPRRTILEVVLKACGMHEPAMTDAWIRALRRVKSSAGADPSATEGGQISQVPYELPADVYGFTGRLDEMAALDELLPSMGQSVSTVVLLTGTAGAGKTALAVRWAHHVATQFPDGGLFIDLRGYGPDDERPVLPENVLATFLRTIGVEPAAVPYDMAERAARYRTLLKDRRVLVVLDNARDVAQIRPLLPHSPGSLVLVTSRDNMAGLVARDGARRIPVDPLPLTDATQLLRTLVGERVDTEPAATHRLVEQCAQLPLALRIVAEQASTRTSATIEKLTRELDQHQLDCLTVSGDERSGVRMILSWSHRYLAPDAARAFWLMSLHPCRGIAPEALAAIWEATPATTRRLAEALVHAHLAHHHDSDRLGMHDLLRAYAAEHAARQEPSSRRAAVVRMLDHYLTTADAAAGWLFPPDLYVPLPALTPRSARFTSESAALAWLDQERPTLVAVVAYASDNGWWAHACGLSGALWRYLDRYGHYSDGLMIHSDAIRAFAAGGAVDSESIVRRSLGIVHWRTGRYVEALDHLSRAVALARMEGNTTLEAAALNDLANVCERSGRYDSALDYGHQAIEKLEASGQLLAQGRALANVAVVNERLGRYDEAYDSLRRALAIAEGGGDRLGQILSLTNLGIVCASLGRHDQAERHFLQALTMAREDGDRSSETATLVNLGMVRLRAGRIHEAIDLVEHAGAIAQELGEPRLEISILNGLGDALRANHDHEPALAQHCQALARAREVHDTGELARALSGAAHALRELGRHDQARQFWQEALTLWTELGLPEAAQARAQLEQLSSSSADQPGSG